MSVLPVAQGASGETVLERVRCTFSRLIALLRVENRLGYLQSGDSVYTGRECRCVTSSSAKEGRKGYRADGHNRVRGGSSASQGYVERPRCKQGGDTRGVVGGGRVED